MGQPQLLPGAAGENRRGVLLKVFSKLDITSRNQLDRVLPDNAHTARIV